MSGSTGLGANVGTAWVALRFSARGAAAQIRSQIAGETAGLGTMLGNSAGKAMQKSFQARLGGVGKTLQSAGKKWTTHLTLPIAGIGIESAKMAVDFQSAMTKIRTQAGASQKEVDKMSKAVLRLAKYSEQGPQQLAEGLYHLESLGLRGAKALSALKTASDLAAVSGANLEETTSAIGGAWRTGVAGAKNFTQAAATLNSVVGAGNMRMTDLLGALGTGILPAAKTFGLNLRQVGAALALFTDEGVPAQEAATRLRMSFSLLGAPTQIASKQLKKIGLSGLALANAMRSKGGLIAAISLLKKHLDKSRMSASQQAALLSRAFGGGRSSSAILSMINNLDVLKLKQDQVNKSAGKFRSAVIEQRKTAAAQWALMVSSLQRAGIMIGNALLPKLTKLTNFVGGIAEKFNALPNSTKNVILAIAGITAVAGPALWMLGSMARGVVAIIAVAKALRLAAAAQWVLNLAMDANPIGLIILGVTALAALIVVLWKRSKTFRKIVTAAFGGVKDAALAVWHWLGRDFVPFFTKTIPTAFNTVLNWVRKHWPWLLGALTGPIGLAVVWIVRHWKSIYKGIKAGWNTTVGFIRRIPGWIWNALKSLPRLLWNLGKQALNQLWRGALSMGSKVVGWFRGLGSSIIRGIKDIFGIHSPSRVMYDIGGHLMQGLVNGLNRKYGQVKGWFARMGKHVTAGVAQWSGLVHKALSMLGLPQSLASRVLYQMQTESGGNPNAINLWDVNAKRGDPSRGLMQVIGSTFAAYHVPGTSRNIFDPLANIAAAINYARARYGPTLMSGGMGIGSGHGYDKGGLAHGLGFMAKYTLAPERVLSPRQTSAFERLVDLLDGWSGGSRPLEPRRQRVEFDPRTMEMWIRDLSAQEARGEIDFAPHSR